MSFTCRMQLIFDVKARQLFRKLGIGGGNSLLGALAICFLPLPYVLYKVGRRRVHSHSIAKASAVRRRDSTQEQEC
jgi:DHA1 family multidrug resistance protein-like MFS transporter